MRFLLLVSFLFTIGSIAWADLQLDGLTQGDVDGVNRDFSALLSHTTVSPAGGLLKPKVFEVGIVAGLASLPNISAKMNELDEGSAPGRLPNAGLIGLYSYSKKTTFEMKYIPDITFGDMYLGNQSFAVKFSTPDTSEFITAIRLQLTNSYVRYKQDINNASTGNQAVSARNEFASISIGASVIEGSRFVILDSFVFEPYIGLGGIQSFATFGLKSSQHVSILKSGKKSASSSEFGPLFSIGMNLHYFFSKFGFEYSRVFDSDRVMVKISFGY